MNCKTCKRKFHACSSCGLYTDWERHYCTKVCWERSPEYQRNNKLIVKFIYSLNNEQLYRFGKIMDLDDDYIFVITDLIETREESDE